MPSLDDFAAARQAAFDCANASIWLLNVARKPVPEATKAEWIARHLDQLARALVGASGAISRVEDDLIRAAVPNGTVKTGGMECATAHRLALDFAGYLGKTIRDIDPGLVPRGLTPKWPPPRTLGVDVELVSKRLPVIVAKLAARPPFDAQHVESRIQHEWAGATDRLASARHEPARPTEAPPAGPPAGPPGVAASDDPESIRGPHGFRFTYSPTTLPASQQSEVFDPSKHPEWIARIEEFQRGGLEMEKARLADPMPDPDALTVGELIAFIAFLSRTPMEWLANPIIGQQCNRRDVVLMASPGWKAFLDWKDRARLHRLSRLEAAERLRDEVGERTGMLTREIESMPLMEAVRLLEQSAAPAGPLAAPSPSGTATPGALVAARRFAADLRHHERMAAAPGYDRTTAVHRLAAGAVAAKAAVLAHQSDFATEGYWNALETCLDRLVANLLAHAPWDPAAVDGLDNALAALSELAAASVGPSPPAGPDGRTEAAAEQPGRQPEGAPAAASPAGSPRVDRQADAADASGSKAGRLDEPPQEAIDAYRAVKFAGQKQETVAGRFGVSQGTISRWMRRVAEWIKAGNVLPDLDAPKPKTVTMDPRKMEQGPRLR